MVSITYASDLTEELMSVFYGKDSLSVTYIVCGASEEDNIF